MANTPQTCLSCAEHVLCKIHLDRSASDSARPKRKPHTRKVKSHKYIFDSDSSSSHSTTVHQGEQDRGHKTGTRNNSFSDTRVSSQDLANFSHRMNGAGISSAELHYNPQSSSSINNFRTGRAQPQQSTRQPYFRPWNTDRKSVV